MRTRKRKLIGNLLLIALCLILLWYLEGRPLPDSLEYRVAEKSYFLEPRDVIYVNNERGVTLSRDVENLYIHRSGTIHQTYYVNHMSWAMARGEEELIFYAVEETGKAVRAELEERFLSDLELPELTYRAATEQEAGVFQLVVEQKYNGDNGDYGRAEIEHFWDIYNNKYYGSLMHGHYHLSITFYDENGDVVGEICETA